jgi:hypothetical protein
MLKIESLCGKFGATAKYTNGCVEEKYYLSFIKFYLGRVVDFSSPNSGFTQPFKLLLVRFPDIVA